jgi:hypothetical protein
MKRCEGILTALLLVVFVVRLAQDVLHFEFRLFVLVVCALVALLCAMRRF